MRWPLASLARGDAEQHGRGDAWVDFLDVVVGDRPHMAGSGRCTEPRTRAPKFKQPRWRLREVKSGPVRHVEFGIPAVAIPRYVALKTSSLPTPPGNLSVEPSITIGIVPPSTSAATGSECQRSTWSEGLLPNCQPAAIRSNSVPLEECWLRQVPRAAAPLPSVTQSPSCEDDESMRMRNSSVRR